MSWRNLNGLRSRYLWPEAALAAQAAPHVFIGHSRPIVFLNATAALEFHNLAKWLDSTPTRRLPPPSTAEPAVGIAQLVFPRVTKQN